MRFIVCVTFVVNVESFFAKVENVAQYAPIVCVPAQNNGIVIGAWVAVADDVDAVQASHADEFAGLSFQRKVALCTEHEERWDDAGP